MSRSARCRSPCAAWPAARHAPLRCAAAASAWYRVGHRVRPMPAGSRSRDGHLQTPPPGHAFATRPFCLLYRCRSDLTIHRSAGRSSRPSARAARACSYSTRPVVPDSRRSEGPEGCPSRCMRALERPAGAEGGRGPPEHEASRPFPGGRTGCASHPDPLLDRARMPRCRSAPAVLQGRALSAIRSFQGESTCSVLRLLSLRVPCWRAHPLPPRVPPRLRRDFSPDRAHRLHLRCLRRHALPRRRIAKVDRLIGAINS